MIFTKESDFEEALIRALQTKGWEKEVIKHPTEQDLLDNWATILFDNNRERDRLNGFPLTQTEMQQIIEQITTLRTPLKLNGFINGKTVSIKRDNPDDVEHFGKEVALKIYDRHEIAAGQSRYQIVQQPQFPTAGIQRDRRGDLMLMINGMPVIHLELKKSGVSVKQAANQIEKYSQAGIFTGLFALVQIFVAMEPEETLYFANPGPDGNFNTDFYFHWANFDNVPINNWNSIATSLLSIPMAHQLIGFYTVPDDADGVLKVMRSYQYYAAHAISDRVAKHVWDGRQQLGGYVWHTTGSGKTMTSFKSAQLIANSKDADKVVFLVDRIELGTQSLKEYRGFAEDNDEIQATENTHVLLNKLTSSTPADTLIVTSIQKMSNIRQEVGVNEADILRIQKKRVVFIVDEAHRSTFGEMLNEVKGAFPDAYFFGFTGTPIHEENKIKGSTTATVFGDELHRYSIADGIRDKNVLGFDPYKVLTYKDRDIRCAVGMQEVKATSEEEAIRDPDKRDRFYYFMNTAPMVRDRNQQGKYTKGVEDYLPRSQYRSHLHQEQVVEDILTNWMTRSRGGKFHALFATSSIREAIEYYRLLKEEEPTLKATALFDSSDEDAEDFNPDRRENAQFKTDGLIEIIEDYNQLFGQSFQVSSHAQFKKDVASRLAHKDQYKWIDSEPEKQLELLIVVDQMLTGFDSKWINTLYIDKVLQNQNIIQAFSRTNRIFGHEKPFGTVRYYRKPHTMERYVEEAVKLYSGDKPYGIYVNRLEDNLVEINSIFSDIQQVFKDAGIPDLTSIPDNEAACGRFASLFRKLGETIEAAKVQGFTWKQKVYDITQEGASETTTVEVEIDENTYLVLALRYKELFSPDSGNTGGGSEDPPYDIEGYLTEIDTGKIDSRYMDANFDKYYKLLNLNPPSDQESINVAQAALLRSFATLSQEQQKYAGIFLRDIERGDITVERGMGFSDYISQYQAKTESGRIHDLAVALGCSEDLLRNMIGQQVTDTDLNSHGRFDELKASVDREKAKEYFDTREGKSLSLLEVNIQTGKLLREFVLAGGFDISEGSSSDQ
ncbi:MAG: HsdR family type I site-specific deoxyribonuclease [Propionibacteriaceae bacterium]|nr:HsdR family type I site-specific deoxyribonuclease [Propionibacteriaceae bacterium]